jgi:hypothetical protein
MILEMARHNQHLQVLAFSAVWVVFPAASVLALSVLLVPEEARARKPVRQFALRELAAGRAVEGALRPAAANRLARIDALTGDQHVTGIKRL